MTLNFDDVSDDHLYAADIEWAVHEGLMYGYGNRIFRPDDPLTRGQLAAVLHRQAWRSEDDPYDGSAAGGETVCDTQPELCEPEER